MMKKKGSVFEKEHLNVEGFWGPRTCRREMEENNFGGKKANREAGIKDVHAGPWLLRKKGASMLESIRKAKRSNWSGGNALHKRPVATTPLP